MREVAIVGAGELGALAAFAVATDDSAQVVRLLDDNGRVAEGKALDINQSAPVRRFSAAVSGSADLSFAAGASVVVIADPVSGASWDGEEGLLLVRRLQMMAPRAFLLCAGSSHRSLVERSVRELHVPPTRIAGSAGEAFAAAATALVALELDLSPHDVALSILGVPPRQIVIAWETAAAAGFALTGLLTEPVRRRLSQRIAALWPVGPQALAAAASKAVAALGGKSRRSLTCFVTPDDRAGLRTRAAALPVRLGPSGIVEVVIPRLSVVERVALDNAMLL